MSCDPVRLKALVEDSGLSYQQNSRSYKFDCPRCNRRNKLFVLKTTGQFVCWRCQSDGFRGKPEFAFAELLLLPVYVVQEKLYGYIPASASDPIELEIDLGNFFGDQDEIDVEALEVIPTQYFPWHFYPIEHPLAKRGREYLIGRGVTPQIAAVYGIHYSPVEQRVVFPIRQGTRLVGWQGRLVGPSKFWSEDEQTFVEKLKIVTFPSAVPRERLLMFPERLEGRDWAVLTEGPISAIKLHLAGGNVATMGKAVSKGQIAMLRSLGIKRAYLALDPDAARETGRLVEELSDMEAYVIDSRKAPTPGSDPGELSLEDGLEVFRSASRVGPGSMFIYLG